MSSLPKQQPKLNSGNPINSNANLSRLLSESSNLKSEEAFKGWKDSFLEEYRKFLDPAGVENAQASNGRVVRSLEKLAKTVLTVNDFVKDGKISTESQSVQGTRHLTNMTEQMASSEKELARFMPTTGAEEVEVGYDKFELGAVMIEDGFHVYEHLKTTKDVIEELNKVCLNDVLTANKLSIIGTYMRQIRVFCDVMADLGLFGLMETMMDIYNVKPRSKTEQPKKLPNTLPTKSVKPTPKLSKPKRELDPNTNYTVRAAYTNGYTDPFSGSQPGREAFEGSDNEDSEQGGDGGDDDDDNFIIYFDMKTGTIGKIPRKSCQKVIMASDESGQEQFEGEITDMDEKESLIWDMKKALKGMAPNTPKQGPKRTKSAKSSLRDKVGNEINMPLAPLEPRVSKSKSGNLRGVHSSPTATGKKTRTATDRPTPRRTRSNESLGGSETNSGTKPMISKSKNGGLPSVKRSTSIGDSSPAVIDKKSTGVSRQPPKKSRSNESLGSTTTTSKKSSKSSSLKTRDPPKRTKSCITPGRHAGSEDTSSKMIAVTREAPKRSKSGDSLLIGRSSSISLSKPKPSSDGWAKPASVAATRKSVADKRPEPSSTGWASPGALAARRRGEEVSA